MKMCSKSEIKVTGKDLYGVYKGIDIRLVQDVNTGEIRTIHPTWDQ